MQALFDATSRFFLLRSSEMAANASSGATDAVEKSFLTSSHPSTPNAYCSSEMDMRLSTLSQRGTTFCFCSSSSESVRIGVMLSLFAVMSSSGRRLRCVVPNWNAASSSPSFLLCSIGVVASSGLTFFSFPSSGVAAASSAGSSLFSLSSSTFDFGTTFFLAADFGFAFGVAVVAMTRFVWNKGTSSSSSFSFSSSETEEPLFVRFVLDDFFVVGLRVVVAFVFTALLPLTGVRKRKSSSSSSASSSLPSAADATAIFFLLVAVAAVVEVVVLLFPMGVRNRKSSSSSSSSKIARASAPFGDRDDSALVVVFVAERVAAGIVFVLVFSKSISIKYRN
eukprot:PhM_4_TR2402/c0_g1_i1/m.18615